MNKSAATAIAQLRQRSRDAAVVRRALAILRLADDGSIASVAEQISAARSSVYRWQAAVNEGYREVLKEKVELTDRVEAFRVSWRLEVSEKSTGQRMRLIVIMATLSKGYREHGVPRCVYLAW